MSDRPTLFHRLSLLALAAALSGCSLAYDLNLDQCQVDADCASIGQGLICGSDNICKIDDRGCGSHSQCVAENGGPWACIKEPERQRGECVNLQSPECPMLLPLQSNAALDALEHGDPVILGGFTRLTLSPFLYNFDMAVSEFNESNGGLTTSEGVRPVVMVACNGYGPDAPDPDSFSRDLDASMDHLIRLKVPGVVSALAADDLKRVVESKGLAANMFFMSSQESDSSLNSFLDKNLLWQVLPGGGSLGRSYRPVVDRTLDYLQRSGALTGNARIAQISTPDVRVLAEMSAAVQSSTSGIVFNGMNVLQNIENQTFLTRNTPSFSADQNADLSETVEELFQFKPHVIISVGSSEFLAKIVLPLEAQWNTRVPDQARPFYVLSPLQYGTRSALNTMVATSPTVRQRVIGLNAPAAPNADLYDSYLLRYIARYRPEGNAAGFENFYDAAYYLLYAGAAAQPRLTDGLSLSAGMFRLLNGTTRYVGPNQAMSDVFSDLTRSSLSTISLHGTMGAPKFDRETGNRDDAASVWCLDEAGVPVPDVLTYDDSNGTMQGTFPCFPNF